MIKSWRVLKMIFLLNNKHVWEEKIIARNSAVYMEELPGRQQVKRFLGMFHGDSRSCDSCLCFGTISKDFLWQRIFGNELHINLFLCFWVSCVFYFKLAKSRRTAGAESFQEAMSNEGASSVRLRSSLDFSKCGKMQMPRGGIFNSDSSNNLMFSGSKTQLKLGFLAKSLV